MRVLPQSNELTAPYWEAARSHRLVVQRCGCCGRFSHPPVVSCPSCHASGLDWQEVSGRGVVYAFTVVCHSVHPVTAGAVPYVLVVVELEEGPRLLTNLRRCEPSDVRVGMPVEVSFEDLDGERSLPQFAPAKRQD